MSEVLVTKKRYDLEVTTSVRHRSGIDYDRRGLAGSGKVKSTFSRAVVSHVGVGVSFLDRRVSMCGRCPVYSLLLSCPFLASA